MQRITDNPASIAALVFCATSSESSLKRVRRSECPLFRNGTWVRAKCGTSFDILRERTEDNVRDSSVSELSGAASQWLLSNFQVNDSQSSQNPTLSRQ